MNQDMSFLLRLNYLLFELTAQFFFHLVLINLKSNQSQTEFWI